MGDGEVVFDVVDLRKLEFEFVMRKVKREVDFI